MYELYETFKAEDGPSEWKFDNKELVEHENALV
jgi:hypothetical protein